jgi:hypothetical protein
MKKPAETKPPSPPAKPEITLAGKLYPLTWNRGAFFRADGLDVFHAPAGTGFAQAAKYIWCMLPDEGRLAYPSPEAVAEVMNDTPAAQAAVNAAIVAGGEDMDPKKVLGLTNGRSQSPS